MSAPAYKGKRYTPGSVEWRKEHTEQCESDGDGDPFDLVSCDCPVYLCLPHQCDVWRIGTREDARRLAEDLYRLVHAEVP